MAGALTTKPIKDATGTSFDAVVWDYSGTGSAGFSFAQQLANSAGTALLAKAEDAAHTSGDEGILALVVRKDTAASLAGTDGDYSGLIVDSIGRLWTHIGAIEAGANLIGKVDHSSTGIGHGVKTVTSAGTDEALAGSTAAKWVTVQSQTDNTGWIAVGATGVDATEATGTGVLLDAGESITMPIDNLADVFIDATVSGEGVRYTYGT